MVTKAEKRAVSLADYLESSAERFPKRTAVMDPDGAETSYEELNSCADRVAAFLATRGVGPGDRVAVFLPKSSLAVMTIFGILKTRAAYVPIDWTAPPDRVRAILGDCKTKALFTTATLANGLEGATELPATIVVTRCPDGSGSSAIRGANTWEEVQEQRLPTVSCEGRSREDLAYILYTSGSTGIPKGVMLSHGNALSFVDWCSSVFQPTEDDRFSSHAPFHFDLSVLDLYVSLKHGASVHLIDDTTGKNPKKLTTFVAERRLTVWYSTPSILHLMTSFGNLQQVECSSLRIVLFAGEVFPIKHLRELTKLWPHVRYCNLYGPTETNVCTYAWVPSQIPEDRREPYPIGWPCSHCSAVVLDEDGGEVIRGGEGILYIAGESVFQGYWNRPKENSAAFRERNGVRWYCTGDVVREQPDDGYVYCGRRDRMVKRRGYRIELDDIERALYRHDGIRKAAVIAVETAGADLKIVAFLEAQGEPRPGIIEMKVFCGRYLPAYMSPDVFTFADSLPRTSTDKTDYQALARSFREGATLGTIRI
ncbi:MAG: amino acid adenylation domain-containing protein [Terriglobales bacterium]